MIAMDSSNTAALEAIDRINNRKKLEFTGCEKYERQTEEDPLKDLFE
jgi:hypothetical protein